MADRETLIRMAQEIAEQCVRSGPPTWQHDYAVDRIIELMNATAAAERETCAKVAEDMCEYGKPYSAAATIRARGNT